MWNKKCLNSLYGNQHISFLCSLCKLLWYFLNDCFCLSEFFWEMNLLSHVIVMIFRSWAATSWLTGKVFRRARCGAWRATCGPRRRCAPPCRWSTRCDSTLPRVARAPRITSLPPPTGYYTPARRCILTPTALLYSIHILVSCIVLEVIPILLI